jgi:hypothetical protein
VERLIGFKRDHGWSRDTVRAGLRWVVDHRLVLAVGLAAALPVIVSTVRALLAGWNPVFDDAIIATRSFDVLSSHSPLVGEHSDASLTSVGPVFSPGPMLNWLLAIPTHLPGDWALPVTMGLLNTASIMGAVALARRRGGAGLMFATALSLAVLCRSLPQETLHDPDNSRAAVLAFTFLLFLGWSVACGEYRLLPPTVFVASLVVQAHFSLGMATFAVLVVALAGLARSMAWSRRREARSGDVHPRGWLLAALGVGLVCWSAPLLDQAIHRPGNLVRIAQTATTHQPAMGVSYGWHAVVRAVGVPPWWLRYPTTRHVGGRFFELAGAPSAAAIASWVLILGGLCVVAPLGMRRRRPDVMAAAALALLLNGAIVVFTASTPRNLALSLDYGLRWAEPVGMFTWLVFGWSLAILLRPTRWQIVGGLRSRRTIVRPALVAFAASSITAIVAVLVTINAGSDVFQWSYRPVRSLTSSLVARLPRRSAVMVTAGSIPGDAAQEALVYQLRRSGYRVLAPSDLGLAVKFGEYYSDEHQRYDTVLFVGDSNTPAPRGSRMIVSVPVHGAPPGAFTQQGKPPPTTLTASVLPAALARVDAACPPPAPVSTSGLTTNVPRPAPGRVAGSVEASQILGNTAQFCGWAANAKDHQVGQLVLVYSDGHLVGAAKPTISRPDVMRGLGLVGENSGYSLDVPLSEVQHGTKEAKVELVAIERDAASILPFACGQRIHDFGC